MEILKGLFGLMTLIGIAWAFSNNKTRVDWKLVATGVSVQIVFAFFVLQGKTIVEAITPSDAAAAATILFIWTRVILAGFITAGLLGYASTLKKVAQHRNALFNTSISLAIFAAALSLPFLSDIFVQLGRLFVKLIEFTSAGSTFIFGDLARQDKMGFIFAFQVLPTIIFFAAFMGVLYHLGIMQKVVQAMAWAITKVMNVSGAETTSVCASVFIGQTEAPLTVRPYINKMTESELLTMMIGGMAHIAGGVMATYISMLGGTDVALQAEYAKHFLAASIMAAPATLLIAKVLIPETAIPQTRGSVKVHVERESKNIIDAAAAGAADGVKLAINIAAMLLAFIALIALLNSIIGWAGDWTFGDWHGVNAALNQGAAIGAVPIKLNLGLILGYILAPIAWVIGIEWNDAVIAGGLIGQKIVLNEFVAYLQLAATPVGDGIGAISSHSRLILTYALCGFANFSSIAIQIGGIGGLAPERRSDLARLGMRAVLGGTIATLMTATIAGVLLSLNF